MRVELGRGRVEAPVVAQVPGHRVQDRPARRPLREDGRDDRVDERPPDVVVLHDRRVQAEGAEGDEARAPERDRGVQRPRREDEPVRLGVERRGGPGADDVRPQGVGRLGEP